MKKNVIYNVMYQILILALPLITVPYVSRVLGADGIGTYSYTYSIAYYFMLLAMLGLNNYGNRAIAKTRDDNENLSKEFCSIYAFQIITSVLSLVLYLIYVNLFDNQYKNIALIQTMYVASTIFDINWFYFGIEKFKLTVTRNTIIKIISLILIFLLVKGPNDLWKYVAILAGSTLFSNIVLFSFLKKYVTIQKVSIREIARHIKPCLVLFIPVIAVSIYRMMDKIMIGKLSNISEVGYYENAEKITQVPVAVIAALGTVMLPRASNMISNNQEKQVINLIEKTIKFVMFLAFAMTFGVISIGKDFSVLFFGEGFEKSGLLIQLLSITIVFLAWGNVIRTQYLIPKEMDKEYIISSIIAAGVNFVFNTILINRFGAIGACVGTIIAEFIVMFYQSWAVRQKLPFKKYLKEAVQFLIKGIIMFIFVVFVGKIYKGNVILVKLIIQIVTGIIIYFILNIKYVFNELGIKDILKKLKGEQAK